MRALPDHPPQTDRRLVTRVAPDPYVRFDTNDYSLDPRLVGRRVEVRISQRELVAWALDSGELAARHRRSFARHRTFYLARARPGAEGAPLGLARGRGRAAPAGALRRPDPGLKRRTPS